MCVFVCARGGCRRSVSPFCTLSLLLLLPPGGGGDAIGGLWRRLPVLLRICVAFFHSLSVHLSCFLSMPVCLFVYLLQEKPGSPVEGVEAA